MFLNLDTTGLINKKQIRNIKYWQGQTVYWQCMAIAEYIFGKTSPKKYPDFMNYVNLTWPKSAGCGKLLSYEHDKYWLEKNFADYAEDSNCDITSIIMGKI